MRAKTQRLSIFLSVLIVFFGIIVFLQTRFVLFPPTTLIDNDELILEDSHDGKNVEEDFVTSDGVRLHYWFYNRGTEVATIFLHGGPGHGSSDFRMIGQAERYADRFGSLLVFDQRGCGESEKDQSLASTITFARFLQDINELRNHVIPGKRVIIFSRSFGGLLAAHYAASHPEGVMGYILVAPGAFDNQKLEEQRQVLERTVGLNVIESITSKEKEKIKNFIPEVDETYGLLAQEEEQQILLDVDVGAAFRENEGLYTHDDYQLLAAFADTPVLVVSGSYDLMVPPLAIEAMKPYLPNAIFVQLEGTHRVAYAKEDEFFEAIDSFLVFLESIES